MFFCKQKTAYDMRISDWSSDVCSSDLLDVKDLTKQNDYKRTFLGLNLLGYLAPSDWTVRPYLLGNVNGHSLKFLSERTGGGGVGAGLGAFFNLSQNLDVRSEEHTSELPSLMRISYDVFCLKKQKLYIPTLRLINCLLHM